MIDLFKNNVIGIVIAILGGIGGYFQGTAAAKEASATSVQKDIAKIQTIDAVQDTQIGTLIKDVAEIKADVKEIKQLFYEDRGWNKPTTKVKNTLLIGGVDSKTGEPKNETE